MAEVREDRPEIYLIPDNFIDEQRIINGLFRLRYFIEGIILALIVGIPLFVSIHVGLYPKIIIMISVCGPVFLFGNAGLNGDPLSVALKNYRSWNRCRRIMLYEGTPHALRKSLADVTFDQEETRDKLLNAVESFKDARKERMGSMQYVEGETFEFKKDAFLTEWAIEVDAEKQTEKKSWRQSKKKTEGPEAKPAEDMIPEEEMYVFEEVELEPVPAAAETTAEQQPEQPKITTAGQSIEIGEGDLY